MSEKSEQGNPSRHCPHCGHVQENYLRDRLRTMYEGEYIIESTCSECGKEFFIVYSYNRTEKNRRQPPLCNECW